MPENFPAIIILPTFFAKKNSLNNNSAIFLIFFDYAL